MLFAKSKPMVGIWCMWWVRITSSSIQTNLAKSRCRIPRKTCLCPLCAASSSKQPFEGRVQKGIVMLYPVYVHVGGPGQAHGVTFPDFPGCFSAADEWRDLPAAVQEAVEAHFLGEPDKVPAPTSLESLVNDPEYMGGVWMLVDLDLSQLDTRPVRLNVSLPAHLVHRIDAWAQAHHMTRSGFLASAAAKAIASQH